MEESSVDLRVVYKLLKNGKLLDEIGTVPSELIRPYFPSLISIALVTQNSTEPHFNSLRDRLLDFPECNSYVNLLSVDVAAFEKSISESNDVEKAKKQRFEFNCVTALDKLRTVAAFLDEGSSNSSGYATTFVMEYFNRTKCLDELVCAIVSCAKLIPSRYDLPLIVRQLLVLNEAPKIICLTACNLSDSLPVTVDALLSLQFPDEESVLAKNRNAALLKILNVDSSLVNICIDRLIRTSNDLSLALTVMCVCLDSTELVSRLLHALHMKLPIATFIQKSSNKTSVKLLRDRISDALIGFSGSDGSKPSEQTRMAQLLAALRHLAGIRLSTDETRSWLLFLTRTDCMDDQYICVALAALVAYPQLIPPHLADEKEIEASLIAFFDWLKQHASGETRPMQQFFLLLSIHLHAAQCEQISALISCELKFKVVVNIRSLAALRNLFLRHGMSERDIAELASRMRVTSKLCNNIQGYLPVHCVTQLLTTHSFSKHLIPVKEWVSAQILECTTPVHSAVVDLVTAYAASCFPTPDGGANNAPLSELFVQELFSGEVMDDTRIVPRIITFFFVLSYRKAYDNAQKAGLQYFYGPQTEAAIPVRYLLNVVEARPLDFEAVRSSLFLLCGQYYPYMLPIPDSLIPSIRREFTSSYRKTDKFDISEQRVNAALAEIQHNAYYAIRIIEKLESKSLRVLIQYRDCIIKAMKTCLDQHAPVSFVQSVTLMWKKLENVIPRVLFQETVRIWTGEMLTHEKLVGQPLLLFRCDDAVFENEHLFSCFLHLLSFYTLAGRTYLAQKLHASLATVGNKEELKMEREELTRSLIGAEDSAIVQILLEICDRFKNPAVHDLACAHIHHMFIAEPLLPKVVHFQGYPLKLIPLAVKKIPSMHICIKWVHELLAAPDLSKRLFAIVLIAELAEQYKIESSYMRVELLLDVLTTLERVLPCDEILYLIYGAVGSLGRMMRLFPQVTADIAHFLSRISAVATSRMAVSATVLKSPFCLERLLIDAINRVLTEKTTSKR